ncbi:MAG: hypothetical protein HZB29_01215 [Nitrospinae bacterium]|nr:hypothetical protein [Nitrospinota bacterium]
MSGPMRAAINAMVAGALADLYLSHYGATGHAAWWKYAVAFSLAAVALWPCVKDRKRICPSAAVARYVCLPLCVALALYYGAPKSFTDTAYFGGDTWEYQSLAVNLAKGHGVNKFGGVEEFSVYKFSEEPREDYEGLKNQFMKQGAGGGSFDSMRTPGYPLFLAAVYSIYGVSPRAAKQAQFLALIIIAASMPYIGYAFWGYGGVAAGIAGAHVFMDGYAEGMAKDILTEPLTAFAAFLAIIAFLRLGRAPVCMNAFAFGAVLAANPLMKGTLIFVPPLFFAYVFVKAWKKEPLSEAAPPAGMKTLAWVAAGFFAVAAPWSVYASVKSGSFVVFSTQAKSIIQDNNNEMAYDGDWHPEGAAKFYERPEIKGLPLVAQAASFYMSHPQMFPGIFFNKLDRGFDEYLSLKIMLIFVIYEAATGAMPAFAREHGKLIKLSGYALTVALAAALSYAYYHQNEGLPHIHILMVAAMVLIAVNALKGGAHVSLPAPFAIFVINMAIVTLVTYGSTRFTGTLAFMYIAAAAGYIASFATAPLRRLNHG